MRRAHREPGRNNRKPFTLKYVLQVHQVVDLKSLNFSLGLIILTSDSSKYKASEFSPRLTGSNSSPNRLSDSVSSARKRQTFHTFRGEQYRLNNLIERTPDKIISRLFPLRPIRQLIQSSYNYIIILIIYLFLRIFQGLAEPCDSHSAKFEKQHQGLEEVSPRHRQTSAD